jgi:hypothetical protein
MNLKRNDLATAFTAWALITMNIEVVQRVFKILLIVLGQIKALRFLSTEDRL